MVIYTILFPHTLLIAAVNVIVPLAIFVSVVCGELGELMVTVYVGEADHVTEVPLGKLLIVYRPDVLQTILSPVIDMPAFPE